MTTEIKFGTDGWRAIIAEDFTFANVRVVAQSFALYLKEAGLAERGLVVGYDTRFASEDFAAAVAEVIAANGIHVFLCDRPAPTPVVGYAILNRKAGGAQEIEVYELGDLLPVGRPRVEGLHQPPRLRFRQGQRLHAS